MFHGKIRRLPKELLIKKEIDLYNEEMELHMFLFDTHIHTSEVSPCSNVSAEDMVKVYLESRYDGVVITDHYSPDICDFESEPGLTTEGAVKRYLSGYETALSAAAGRLTVLLGMELRFHGLNNDFLVFGMSEEFLLKYPDIRHMNPFSFHSLAQENNLLFYAAHPFRNGMKVISPSVLDGIEVMNGHPNHDSRNNLADIFADQFQLLKSSGSDFHDTGCHARGGILTKTRIRDNQDLIECLKNQPSLIITE